MSMQDHRQDYIAELTKGKWWQIGTRTGLTHRTSENGALALGAMFWRGKEWQLGHVSLPQRRQRHYLQGM